MILGCCLNFSMIFSKGSWICSTLASSSSLHCKPRDGTIGPLQDLHDLQEMLKFKGPTVLGDPTYNTTMRTLKISCELTFQINCF